ncbi:DNA cytosine methyltransferase [Euhalothece natronophila Z-M001]|uniref:Cytosine-specific methyltransferase n=1 Tax=Euhalothece natronophila Z-M001 TaxID=522448 RepID=A0A5B8NR90_9CHRO|nr:DNA cytosine methyltransferase [Euhalothece natronophila]QDZ40809.1 DNA cytosine methyltransferase [Euhalothece natronophila Z-M001]
MNRRKKKRAIAVDLFSGVGGMTLGFEQAGFDVLASVDIDPIHCAAHKFNFPFWSIICQDVQQLTGDDIRQSSLIQDQEIDVVCGGPPCQGFSLIGKRVLEDDRNALVFHFLRLVLELNPKYFVMENVAGMAIGKSQQLLEELIANFQKNGYNIQLPYQVLNASNFGVPQNRKRLFLLGSRQDQVLPNYPTPITKPAKGKVTSLNSNYPDSPTVKDALIDLPSIENYPELLTQDTVKAEFGQPSSYSYQLRHNGKASNDYSYPRNYDSSLLTASLRTQHTEKSRARFAETPPGKTEPISRFYKLDPDGICNTLRAGTASNRGAYTSPRPIHPYLPRCITVREAARLHSYPDWFRFHVTKWHGFRQIGNSVPPFLAKAVAQEIIKVLGVIPLQISDYSDLGEENLLSLEMSKAAQLYKVSPHVIAPRTRKNKQGVKNNDQ